MPVPADIRPADVGDAAAVADVYRPWVTGSVASFETVPPDADEMARRMTAQPRLPWFVACRDGAVVGYAYGGQHRTRAAYRWSVDCSVYLAAGERGAGTGRALYERLLPELRDLGHVTAFAGIALPNPASVGLHTALGFTPVGVYRAAGFKAGRWHDVGWWQLPLREPPAEPAEPAAWSPGAPARPPEGLR
ncbi:arsinothricin resistance N-acetyltransferase ArsN1 family B [Modestobacter versicolor]|uniref:arsinothricin resistance N-acetyltransferase ArsN1 family B n=1 Tax=Modestobacter versicolor TaxID=429133 RepID=UPI0034DEC537